MACASSIAACSAPRSTCPPRRRSASTAPYIVLFQDGKPVSIRDRTLVVEKAGAERMLYLFAKDRPWTYGVVSVIVALGAGWAASVAFRRS
jgi:hypothetical protein